MYAIESAYMLSEKIGVSVKYSIVHHNLFTELTYFLPIIKVDKLISISLYLLNIFDERGDKNDARILWT